MTDARYDRQVRLFGREGQEKLSGCHVAVVGIGGLGTHVVQQLALLGVGHLTLVDPEELDDTNRNRYVGVLHSDPVPGTRKVDVGERIVISVNPVIRVAKVPYSLVSAEGFAAVRDADCVFGCLDLEGCRLVLTELCAAYEKPYFDLASDIHPSDMSYGGRVCSAVGGQGCLVCYEAIDLAEAGEDLESPEERRRRADVYGVPVEDLARTGPSVVSINGVVASLGVTEFLVWVTGMREPRGLSTYRGYRSIVTVPGHDSGLPRPDCYCCKGMYGKGDEANVERYLGR